MKPARGVICSYYQCREYATKNLTVTEPLEFVIGSEGKMSETYEVPYCDRHFEEYR